MPPRRPPERRHRPVVTGSTTGMSCRLPRVVPETTSVSTSLKALSSTALVIGEEVCRQVGEEVVGEVGDERGQHPDALLERGGRLPDLVEPQSPREPGDQGADTRADPLERRLDVVRGTVVLGDGEDDLEVRRGLVDGPGHRRRVAVWEAGSRVASVTSRPPWAMAPQRSGRKTVRDGQDPAIRRPGAQRREVRGEVVGRVVPEQASRRVRRRGVALQVEGPPRGLRPEPPASSTWRHQVTTSSGVGRVAAVPGRASRAPASRRGPWRPGAHGGAAAAWLGRGRSPRGTSRRRTPGRARRPRGRPGTSTWMPGRVRPVGAWRTVTWPSTSVVAVHALPGAKDHRLPEPADLHLGARLGGQGDLGAGARVAPYMSTR